MNGFRLGRRGLLDACQALKLGTKSVVKSGPNRGRVSYRTGGASDAMLVCWILEKVYGAGIQWAFKTNHEATTRALRAAECYLGHYGDMLKRAAECLANAQTEGSKLARYRAQGRGNTKQARSHLAECKRWLEIAGIYQRMHELEVVPVLATSDSKAALAAELATAMQALGAERRKRALPDMRAAVTRADARAAAQEEPFAAF